VQDYTVPNEPVVSDNTNTFLRSPENAELISRSWYIL